MKNNIGRGLGIALILGGFVIWGLFVGEYMKPKYRGPVHCNLAVETQADCDLQGSISDIAY